MRPSRGTRWLVVWAALGFVRGVMMAAVCTETTGKPAPAVVTAMASTKDPAETVWVLQPNCSFEATTSSESMALTRQDIDRIDSLPSSLVDFTSGLNPLSKGADFSSSPLLNTIYISQFSSSMINALVLPPALTRIDLVKGQLTSVDNVVFPDQLESLFLTGNKLTSIDPSRLPKKLMKLSIRNDTFASLSRMTFGDSIRWLDFSNCSISSVKGTKWSRSLQNLNLEQNFITEFEIRQSDVTLIANLTAFLGNWTLAGCSTPGAELTVVKTINPNAQQWTRQQICVISDARFDELYGTNATSSSSESGSGSSSNAVVVPTPRSSTPETQEPTTAVDAPRKTLVVVVASGGGFVFLVVLPLCLYRVRLKKKTKMKKNHSSISPTGKSGSVYTAATTDDDRNDRPESPIPLGLVVAEEFLPNDVRSDPALVPHRIARQDLHIGDVIARGGFGVIFRGRFDGQPVAVKQMLPGTWQNTALLSRFMDEIHLCARMDHPKIVAFVGLAWSRLRDLSVVIEFMPGGDLHGYLHRQRTPPSSIDWCEPWTSAGISTSKMTIALDVAEAVVYLHSLQTPVIHRDLKARNVLLDADGNAKLSDFGISREVVIDETMTGEIGTVAWIAPEVLRGERYSEKADVYSLGVLLVELDKCRHPYAGHAALKAAASSQADSTGSKVVNKNTQIAVLVSTGKLQPRVGSECPEPVAKLVAQTVSHKPSERPTAMEVFYKLRQARKMLERRQGTLV